MQVGILSSFVDPEAAPQDITWFTLSNGSGGSKTLSSALFLANVTVGEVSLPVATFVVKNLGSQAVDLSALTVPPGFTQVQGFSASRLASQAEATFQISIASETAGTFNGSITFRTSAQSVPSVSLPIQGGVQ